MMSSSAWISLLSVSMTAKLACSRCTCASSANARAALSSSRWNSSLFMRRLRWRASNFRCSGCPRFADAHRLRGAYV